MKIVAFCVNDRNAEAVVPDKIFLLANDFV